MERYDYFKIKYKIDMFHNGYLNIDNFNNGLAHFTKNDGIKNFMDKEGRIGIPRAKFKNYDNLVYYKDGIAIFSFCKRGILEFRDLDDNIINSIECDYYHFSDANFITIKYYNRYGAISYDGKKVIPCKYGYNLKFSEGLCLVKQNIFNDIIPKGKYGYINEDGEEVIPFIYDIAYSFSDGLALVAKDNYTAYINKKGKEKLIFYKDKYFPFSEGLAMKLKNNRYGYIDKKGREVISCIYRKAQPFNNDLAIVQNENWKSGCINKQGKVIVPFKYDNIYKFEDKHGYCIEKDKKYGWVDNEGKEIVPCIYDNMIDFSEGKAAVLKNGKYGYIDTTGKVIIPFVYIYAHSFKEGRAVVNNGSGIGFIDENNKVIIVEEEKYINSISDIPKYAFDIQIVEYVSAFKTADNVIYVRDSNLGKYEKKIKQIEDSLRSDKLSDIYQEVLLRTKKV